MTSPLPPSPGAGPRPPADHLADLADRLGTSVPVLVAGLAVVLAVAVVGYVWWSGDDAPAPELSIPYASPVDPATTATAPPGGADDLEVTVHVAGAVAQPGVYVAAGGARVGDVVAAAGGPIVDADLDRLNLAAPVVDGSRIYVPRQGEVATPAVVGPDVAPAGAATGGPVDLNTADAAALETLPGVGPSTAAAIVAHRERAGPFATVDELLDVRGIGEAKLAALRDLVTVAR